MRVRDGRVLKKNNWRLDPNDYRAIPHDVWPGYARRFGV
jgi:hypothetical protein